jgi:hypothetical protein
MRMILLAAIASTLAVPVRAEDAEHRADRLRTIELNRRAASVVARRDSSNSRVRAINRQNRERYQQQMARWRAQVAACDAGDYAACDR